MSAKNEQKAGGLSLATLVIASCSSVAAALFIHKFWQGGAILGAAFTPIIVALVSEGLRKPVEAVKARTTTVNPPPVAPDPGEEQRSPRQREDKFGIWEDQQVPRKRRPLHLKLALATGLAAFLIAAFFMTGAELVLGGASDSDRFRFVPGKQQKSERGERDRDDAPAQRQPEEQDGAPAPGATTPAEGPEEAVPEETVPQETVPQETVPQTTPAQPPAP
ncbi:MAG TPA: hypothetical protein VGR12_01285 [Solirubrobacteraceae bacterium]|nr:hypothetical protein [Solirubrobacteraceae bacterium]